MKRKIIIDTDPGIDDAAALAIALNNSELEVEMLTTVAGNVNLNYTTENAKKILDFFEKDTPLARGNSLPLLREYEDASQFHGETGMSGYDFPESSRQLLSEHAAVEMKNRILAAAEKITLVTIGPLTNAALLLSMYPEVKDKIEEIVIMGGSTIAGNTNSSAEFNIKVDPHAAQMVINSGLPITIFGLRTTSKAVLNKNDIEEIKTLGQAGEMLYSLFTHYRGGNLETVGLMMHDICTICYLLRPEIFEFQKTYLEVALAGPAAGTTVADLAARYTAEKNVKLAVGIDQKQFRDWVVEEMKKLK
ncbi:Inosine-uridine preferring nucleoside hydrolase [Halanaerobium saccharolyticum subsp. saccharolyticum DSM 6643]|uniref:Inosine-uridine preferring nucleoside hydrolase n=1 Tax=Halanaerobium saccharolyticum subsp. saccharolyticum DSM 6643 TaxID=1293054 RepID=M5E4E5_9FIRM|nr:ribonucleoside hydrolase RihC [Halanaerobium saccharolyticum]CCU80837.1 Inosine-uridine preferring nucleoside hydrolase [Halanaerobium saccharolyticum subsp. saccharolyticum DSM 6643]